MIHNLTGLKSYASDGGVSDEQKEISVLKGDIPYHFSTITAQKLPFRQ
jgi:hypothetical protein